MKIGLSTYGFPVEYLVPLARHLEQLGFVGMWLGEHLVEPREFESVHPYDEGKERVPVVTRARQMYDTFTTAGAILGATTRFTVTSGVLIVPARHPVHVARAAVSAHRISGGRFRLGVGAGWWEEELEVFGVPREERGKRFVESMRLLPRLLAAEWVEGGPMFPFRAARVTEEPANVPLIFGGTGPKQLERMARHGAGFFAPMLRREDALATKRRIEELRAEFGWTAPFSYEVRFRGEPDIDSVAEYLEAGFDTLVVPGETLMGETDYDITLDQALRRAEEIARAFKLV